MGARWCAALIDAGGRRSTSSRLPPPEWSRLAAKTLANSFFFEFPGMGHGAFDAAECPEDITLDFLYDPTAEPDSKCIDDLRAPRFVVLK